MKFGLLIVFMMFIKGLAYGQASVTDDKVAAKIAYLKNKAVNKFVVYYVSCSGARPKIVIDGECTVSDVKYIAWLEKKKSYMQRFDECYEYKAKPVSPIFLNTIDKRLNEIKEADILSPQFKVIHNGEMVLMDLIRDHTCASIFKIYWKNKLIEKHVDQFNLSCKYSDEKQLNVNYLNNQKSILNELYKQVIKETAKTDNSSKSTSLHQ